MNKSLKTLACAAIASIAFFACDDIGTNVNSSGDSPCKVKALSKTCNDERCWYDESDSVFFRPYDPNWVSIQESVKEWMEEQLATGSNDTELFSIVDLFIHENYMALMDIDGPTEREYYVNGRRVSREEYKDSVVKVEKYVQEREIRGKRNLPIPAPIFYETDYSTSSFYWGVPMTAKELAELIENYKQLSVEFMPTFTNGDNTELGGGGAIPMVPPCD
ncbi:MAG: hypothetical protein FWF63_00595 [Fibromonadales bacterium]|nr:hypothetical protein [Fibromonadales bacterium]